MADKNEEVNEITDLADTSKSDAIINRENFEKDIQNIWGHSSLGLEAKRAAMTMLSTKTGMYARIPLTCKGESCPYCDTCKLIPYNLAPTGEPCPIETAEIELRYAAYDKDLHLDPDSFTDRNLVSELINLDIMAQRCKSLMAKEGVPVIDVISGISEQGEEYCHPEVSKYWDAYERTLKRRAEIYDMLMATRKSKKGEGDKTKSITEIIAEIQNGNGFIVEEKPKDFIDVDINENK